MVIYDHGKFKLISQAFFLIALVVYFTAVYILKHRNVEITYVIVLRLVLFIFPIISFPFIFLSSMDLPNKVISTIIALSAGLIQFYGTMLFRKSIKKRLTRLSPSQLLLNS